MNEKPRCEWAEMGNELMREYHDNEWGVPVHDDRKHFEFLLLDGAQAGLSWATILNRRENYRAAFDDFDYEKIARYGEKKISELLNNPGIIRNRLKVGSAVRNARAFLAVREEFGSFNDYIWRFVDGKPIQNAHVALADFPALTDLSDAISKDLKRRGFNFVGSVIIYAYMQAAGLVNDHQTRCFRHEEIRMLSL